ncbi:MAG: hypothetical protein Q9160_001685 [Pyrenula sp. 1 TL-2023]
MPIETDSAYSTLEVVTTQGRPTIERPRDLIQFDPEKQVAFESGKQCISGKGVVDPVISDESIKPEREEKILVSLPKLKNRRWMISLGVLGSIVVLAILLGAILGSRNKKSSRPPPPESSTSSPSAVAPAQRNIAAVSFVSNAANFTQMYFQDDGGHIMEASYASGTSTWTIQQTGIRAKNESAIAAAVSRPNLPLEISVFYLDENNTPSDIIYSASTGQWMPGSLAAQAHIAMPNSSLSAMYNWCELCANTTIIAFQDENGAVKIGNFSSSAANNGSNSTSWTVTQLQQELDPTSGTALSLQPFYRGGMEDQINLYHQKSTGLEMALTCWRPAAMNNGVSGWYPNQQIYDPIPVGSPIAAASSYTNVPTGFETWIEVLSHSGNSGNGASASDSANNSTNDIQVNTWSGAINDWLAQGRNPLTTATASNSTSGGSDTERVYGSLAVTALGQAFAVTTQMKGNRYVDKIEQWQLRGDMLEWSVMGEVDIGGSWGNG